MAENSKIEWCDHTFNPWIGCQAVSPACVRCYAEADNKRRKWVKWGAQGSRRRTAESTWKKPLTWNRKAAKLGIRYKVFCASLADVFDNHRSIPQQWRDDLWQLIRDTPNLDWQLLTKRPQNIKKMLPDDWGEGYANVWLGTTVENQEEADRRIPHLMNAPATVWFLSCEPLLSDVDLTKHFLNPQGFVQTKKWVICGGESGPNARPMHPDWARSLRDQCEQAGVPFLFKQWGEHQPLCHPFLNGGMGGSDILKHHQCLETGQDYLKVGKKRAGRLLDGKEHDGMTEVK